MVLDEIKLTSDDSIINENHVIFLLNKYRTFLLKQRYSDIKKPISVAVMGCVVNGPGEARGADVGIAGGNGVGLVFRKGEIIRKVDEKDLVDELFKEIDAILVEEEK